MKNIVSIAATAAFVAQSVSGHYIFQTIAAGTAAGTPYEYVRKNTNYNSPVTGEPFRGPTVPYVRNLLTCIDLTSNDLRCNVGGATGGNTSTIEIAAGGPFTFTLDTV
jgi:hypothetical protein